MQVDVCIQTRRSVRKYSDQDISGDTLREIVDLARFSPSWKNTQVVRYHVVKNADLKEKIAQNCVLGFDFSSRRRSRRTVCWALTSMPRRSCAATRW